MSNAPSKKVLIVDDEEGIRESLKLILGYSYNLIMTDSGQQALEILQNDATVGLVLLDIKMPEVNGLDVLELIKKEHPALPVIMVTGYKSAETAMEATTRGAAHYILKPFKTEEILATVKKYLTT